MIPYEFYKALHLSMLFILIAALGFCLTSIDFSKGKKIFIGVISFFVFVAGMGLIARLGFKHTEPFPMWINLKILSWILLNVLIVAVVKFKKISRTLTGSAIAGFIFLAMIMAVYKPS